MNTKFWFLPFLVGFSCTGEPRVSEVVGYSYRDTAEKLTPEERELLTYCKKVQEISEKQKLTDAKVEKILDHLESQSPTVVILDTKKKEELRKGWDEIEEQKNYAIRELKEEHNDSGLEDPASGIVTPKE